MLGAVVQVGVRHVVFLPRRAAKATGPTFVLSAAHIARDLPIVSTNCLQAFEQGSVRPAVLLQACSFPTHRIAPLSIHAQG